jgi:hypothetical protein
VTRYAISALIVLVSAIANRLPAQTNPDGGKAFTARPVPSGASVAIDGRLDDAAWRAAAWRSDFLQKVPLEGGAPTASTEVAFLYDGDALYVAARMRSVDPGGIPTTVARRDQFTNAEHFIVALDTYRDRRTAYVFSISSGGVRGDYYNPSDSEGDRELAWDPVWRADATVDSLGWYAEMRIPFSQLRFASGGDQVWGVQINRWMPHAEEDVYWIVIPARETGWASRFGELRGIAVAHAPRRLELTPYIAANATFSPSTPGDPFNDGSLTSARAGADFKMGLGPNLTLDATINPDFGQVEADPAEVNLTAFETFFSERRPFFTEGNQLLVGGGANFYYSRRIGQAPRGSADGEYVEYPSNTTILGAAKLSGRMRSGLSVGALAALTGAEEARTFDAGSGFGRVPIEPFTAYGIGRVQQEFGKNSSTAGLSLTTVRRDVPEGSPLAALLPRSAITGGGDVNLRTARSEYDFGFSFGFSYLTGDPEAMLGIQRHPAHFMQRPDATEFTLDPTRTSLFGWGAGLEAEKNSGRHWIWEVDLSAESPAFDLNDAGQLGSANDISVDASIAWRETEPGRIFRRHSHNWYVGRSWNFGGIHTGSGTSLGNNFQLRNFWQVFLGGYLEARALSDDLTRGGPLMGTAFGHGFDVSLNGSEGAPVTWSSALSYFDDEFGGWSVTARAGIATRPAPRWSISINPRWSRSVVSRQYVSAIPGGPAATFGTRYVFAFVDRNTLSAQIRLNYAFTPDLTLELYAEPFAASGRFHDFGELPAARSRELRAYGTDGTTISPAADGYTVTADGQTFTLPNRDFNVLSFRSNLVLRWEWLRGSTLYLVWQQDRSGIADRDVGLRSLFDTFDADGQNFVALKMTYWLAAR